MSNKINSVCKRVMQITDEEIAEMRDVATGQLNYLSPLKMATVAKQYYLGTHNNLVLDRLVELRITLKSWSKP